jgi:hypothetical protein
VCDGVAQALRSLTSLRVFCWARFGHYAGCSPAWLRALSVFLALLGLLPQGWVSYCVFRRARLVSKQLSKAELVSL